MFAPSRVVIAAFVVVLHVLALAAWLSARWEVSSPPRHENVVEMILSPLPKHEIRKAKPAKGPPGYEGLPLPDFRRAAPSPEALSLGQVVFGSCRPENLAGLPREEREKCERLTGQSYAAYLAAPLRLPPPDPAKLRNSDIAARERNTADPCLIAKQSGTECIHTIIYGKGLP